ncbi:hypothetical protein SBRCBS47491_009053 [Sporothrix bragantina]|uniref:C2H2-type domain-containing protein n=1 Tax=Sporothrix bragantina TaxID=671064 RepID=A0ABP0CRP0_9PEZI
MLPVFDEVFHGAQPPLQAKDGSVDDKTTAKTESSNPLAFLDQQTPPRVTKTPKITNKPSSYPKHLTTQLPHPPLLGGGQTSDDPVTSFEIHPDPISVLYGFQGAVGFDLNNRQSFIDAVLRLVGPLRNVNVAFLKADRDENDQHELVVVHTLYEIVNNSVLDPYCFDMLKRYLEEPFVIESWQVPFVYTPGDILPKRYHQPIKGKEWPMDTHGDDGLVYCRASKDLHRGSYHQHDVAYLMVPPPAKNGQTLPIASNQYREQMMVVARILTPGAGLAIYERGDAGLVPHCRFGLLDKKDPLKLTTPRFLTHGGMGFSQAQWDDLVRCVCATESEHAYYGGMINVIFDVQPIGEHSVGIFLAGVNSDSSQQGQDEGGLDNVIAPPTSIRAGLAKRIDRLLESGTTQVEQRGLRGVDIWPNGLFWDPEIWPIHACIFPCTKGSLERIEDQPDVAPSVIAIRPRYSTYMAHVLHRENGSSAVQDMSFVFKLDDPLDSFLDTVYSITGTGTGTSNARPSLWIRQCENSNRPEFYITHKTTQKEWFVICSQIVGPAIWVRPLDPSDIAQTNVFSAVVPPSWGLRPSYHNFRNLAFHEALYTEQKLAREQQHAVEAVKAEEEDGDAVQGMSGEPVEDPDEVKVKYMVEDTSQDKKQSPADGFADLDVCTLCSHIFKAGTKAAEKLRHMVDAHGILHKQLRAARPGVIVDDGHDNSRDESREKGVQQPTPPRTRTRPKRKSEAPLKGGSSDSSSSGGDGDTGPSNAFGHGAAAKKRKTKFRGLRDKDSAYRPENDGSDDERDHDLGSAKLLAEDLVGEDQLKKRKRAAAKRVNDPTYRPGQDEDDDEDEDSSKFLTPKRVKRGGSVDPSYRPSKAEQEDEDDEDDDKNKDNVKGKGKAVATKRAKRDSSIDPLYRSIKDDGDDGDDDNLEPRDAPKTAKGGGGKVPPKRPNGIASTSVSFKQEDRVEKKSPVVTIGVAIAKAALKGKGNGKAAAKKESKGKAPARGGSAASTPRRGRSRNVTPSVE